MKTIKQKINLNGSRKITIELPEDFKSERINITIESDDILSDENSEHVQDVIEGYKSLKYKAMSIDPEIMGGTPVFVGTRVPVQSLFDYLEGGEKLEEFLDDFPSVDKDSAIQVLDMAKLILTTEKILNENFT